MGGSEGAGRAVPIVGCREPGRGAGSGEPRIRTRSETGHERLTAPRDREASQKGAQDDQQRHGADAPPDRGAEHLDQRGTGSRAFPSCQATLMQSETATGRAGIGAAEARPPAGGSPRREAAAVGIVARATPASSNGTCVRPRCRPAGRIVRPDRRPDRREPPASRAARWVVRPAARGSRRFCPDGDDRDLAGAGGPLDREARAAGAEGAGAASEERGRERGEWPHGERAAAAFGRTTPPTPWCNW